MDGLIEQSIIVSVSSDANNYNVALRVRHQYSNYSVVMSLKDTSSEDSTSKRTSSYVIVDEGHFYLNRITKGGSRVMLVRGY